MAPSCAALYKHISKCLPCQSWLWPASLDDLEEPMLQPPVYQLSDCGDLPRDLPSAVHLPESKWQSWHRRQLQSAGSSSTGSWDIHATSLDGCSTPKLQAMASRQHSGMTTSHDVQDASEGIELRPAKTNVLLGQYHMERSGQFVRSKPGQHGGSGSQPSIKGRRF